MKDLYDIFKDLWNKPKHKLRLIICLLAAFVIWLLFIQDLNTPVKNFHILHSCFSKNKETPVSIPEDTIQPVPEQEILPNETKGSKETESKKKIETQKTSTTNTPTITIEKPIITRIVKSEEEFDEDFDKDKAQQKARKKAMNDLLSKFPNTQESVIKYYAKTEKDTVVQCQFGTWKAYVVLSIDEADITE